MIQLYVALDQYLYQTPLRITFLIGTEECISCSATSRRKGNLVFLKSVMEDETRKETQQNKWKSVEYWKINSLFSKNFSREGNWVEG